MPTLREYFEKDGSRAFCIRQPIQIKSSAGEVEVEIIGRLHLDFESNGKYISYFIPSSKKVACPSRLILNTMGDVLGWTKDLEMQGGHTGEDRMSSEEMQFTGRIFIYSDDPISEEETLIAQDPRLIGGIANRVHVCLGNWCSKELTIRRLPCFGRFAPASRRVRDRGQSAKQAASSAAFVMGHGE